MICRVAGRPSKAPDISAALQNADVLLELEAPGIYGIPVIRVRDPCGDLREAFQVGPLAVTGDLIDDDCLWVCYYI